jgi:hypothetical protein
LRPFDQVFSVICLLLDETKRSAIYIGRSMLGVRCSMFAFLEFLFSQTGRMLASKLFRPAVELTPET